MESSALAALQPELRARTYPYQEAMLRLHATDAVAVHAKCRRVAVHAFPFPPHKC